MLKDWAVWVSIGEMKDVEGRFIGNAIIGILGDEPTSPILLDREKLDKSYYQIIAKLFNTTPL